MNLKRILFVDDSPRDTELALKDPWVRACLASSAQPTAAITDAAIISQRATATLATHPAYARFARDARRQPGEAGLLRS